MTRIIAIATVAALGAASLATAQSGKPAPTPATAPVEAGKPDPSKMGGPIPRPEGGQGFTYTAEGRRDPFVTLMKRGGDAKDTTVAARAAGLAGLGTGEVSLRGIMASRGEFVAMVLGSDDKTYIVRSGDKLADGTIRTITANAMVIVQRVNDPLSPLKQREVRKMLRNTDGTN